MTAAGSRRSFGESSEDAYQLVEQVLVEAVSLLMPVRITKPEHSGSMIGSGDVVLVVVVVVVGDRIVVLNAAAGASAGRSAVGAVALSEHAASTSTAPPKNNAFFQPMEPPKSGMLIGLPIISTGAQFCLTCAARFATASATASILHRQVFWSRNVSHTQSSHSATTTSVGTAASMEAPGRLQALRTALLGVTLFVALLVWVCFSVGLIPQGTHLVTKLRVVGVMTWVYALVQILDMKIWHSRFSQRRRASLRIPEVLEGWLFGQMLAWFGILYYALTDDARWFVAGLVIFLVSFAVFPIRHER